MKCLPLILVACAALSHAAQIPCSTALSNAASRVHSVQDGLKRIQVGEMDTAVPAPARDQLIQLKDALVGTADAALSCAGSSIDPVELQGKLAEILSANPPEPPDNTIISKDDHRFDEFLGSYGHNLRVRVGRSPRDVSLLEVEFSINIECGSDHLLLIYALQKDAWHRLMRWQAPPLKKVSDAFGGFFLSAILSAPETGDFTTPRLVVAHGTPWCTSRFSGLNIDVLSPTSDSNSPKVLWHTERGYSRGDFEPRMKSSGNIFEFRINDSCMDIDSFERRVIYRYRVEDDQVQRLQPIAINARGFVEEWLSAPWSEALLFSTQESAAALKAIHNQFEPPVKSETEFVTHTYGPVRACKAPGIFQVQINSMLEKVVPGKPGGDSRPLPSYYFHVRDIKIGYSMLSANTKADSTCTGSNLMPEGK